MGAQCMNSQVTGPIDEQIAEGGEVYEHEVAIKGDTESHKYSLLWASIRAHLTDQVQRISCAPEPSAIKNAAAAVGIKMATMLHESDGMS